MLKISSLVFLNHNLNRSPRNMVFPPPPNTMFVIKIWIYVLLESKYTSRVSSLRLEICLNFKFENCYKMVTKYSKEITFLLNFKF